MQRALLKEESESESERLKRKRDVESNDHQFDAPFCVYVSCYPSHISSSDKESERKRKRLLVLTRYREAGKGRAK